MRSTQRDTDRSVVARVTALLSAFEPHDHTLGVSELARRTGLSKSTTSRLVAELVRCHLLEREGRAVRLGVLAFELGELAARPRDLRRAAAEHMSDLGRATGQTVHLAVLDGADVVYVHIVRSHRGPPMPSRIGGRMPAHATGLGKALLAHAGPEAFDAVVGRGLTRAGPRTITAASALADELERVRGAGVAYEREESAPHVGCAASPVFGGGDVAVAAVSVSGWSGRMDVRRVGPAVRLAALAIGRRLPVSPAVS